MIISSSFITSFERLERDNFGANEARSKQNILPRAGENIVTRWSASSFSLSMEFAVKTRDPENTVKLRVGDVFLLEA